MIPNLGPTHQRRSSIMTQKALLLTTFHFNSLQLCTARLHNMSKYFDVRGVRSRLRPTLAHDSDQMIDQDQIVVEIMPQPSNKSRLSCRHSSSQR